MDTKRLTVNEANADGLDRPDAVLPKRRSLVQERSPLTAPPTTRTPVFQPPAAPPISWRRARAFSLTALGVFVVLYLGWITVTARAMKWSVIHRYFFSHVILIGLRVTIELALMSQLIAIVIGIAFALFRRSGSWFLRTLSWGYVTAFRSTPLLVQILVWYNLALFFPRLSIGLPFTGIATGAPTNQLISALTASLLGLGLNEGAYMAEIIRGGINAVPESQIEAGLSLGMTPNATFRRIVAPQALRIVIPPTGNQFIGLLKATSLVSIVGGGDLLTRSEGIYDTNFLVIPLLVVATLWYLVLTSVATVGQHYLERWLEHEERTGGGLSEALTAIPRRLLGSPRRVRDEPASPGAAGPDELAPSADAS